MQFVYRWDMFLHHNIVSWTLILLLVHPAQSVYSEFFPKQFYKIRLYFKYAAT